MGLDFHAKSFLTYITKSKGLGTTLTLGRQGDHTDWINPETGTTEIYCEPMLHQLFGATNVESVDASDYEGATYIQDLNEKWESFSDMVDNKYSSILDFGTLEHVFNVPQALRSMCAFCEVGGRIIHVQCHSDFCGHGFWQFSAELFFSWYSESNGFSNVEIFIAPLLDPYSWYRCLRPEAGRRSELSTRNVPCSYILVVAHKTRDVPNPKSQQSDYVALWEQSNSSINKPFNASESIMQPRLLLRGILRKLRTKVAPLLPYEVKLVCESIYIALRGIISPWWDKPYIVKEKVRFLIEKS